MPSGSTEQGRKNLGRVDTASQGLSCSDWLRERKGFFNLLDSITADLGHAE